MITSSPSTVRHYCRNLTAYSRRKTREVTIGDVPLGAHHPIRVQSMTTVDTMDTEGSVQQAIRMIEAGCEYVRITAPSIKEAQNLENIKRELRKRGYATPLVADIHFTPNAAELAARIVEKVRINPGNYADKKKFETIEYTDASYQAEIERIYDRFLPLVKICREYGTAMRIGTNHGSLSDRIMSRYGDTPLGMVESALEFIRICEDLGYYDLVISMKASNTQVMVQAYRLLVSKLDEEGLQPYPLHLGVTEAGDGEDGRIKSAVGIGTLLEDGLGDTVRVSLTEEPEAEMPVGFQLVNRYRRRTPHAPIPPVDRIPQDPYRYRRRETHEVGNIGGGNVPRVVADGRGVPFWEYRDLKHLGHYYLPEPDKWTMNDQGSDYVYSGAHPIDFMLPNGLKEIRDYPVWQQSDDRRNKLPLFSCEEYQSASEKHPRINFLRVTLDDWSESLRITLKSDSTLVVVLDTNNRHAMPEQRRFFFALMEENLTTPVIILRKFATTDEEQLTLYAATDVGGLLIDGLGDGVLLSTELAPAVDKEPALDRISRYNSIAFGILQAARTRMSKTRVHLVSFLPDARSSTCRKLPP